MTYCIPAAQYHTTSVAPSSFHATLFCFDAERGFAKDAGVIGPIDGKSFTATREVADYKPTELVAMIDSMRRWEKHINDGRSYARRALWEEALREFDRASYICDTSVHFPTRSHSQAQTFIGLAYTNRRFGRYERSENQLQQALEASDDKGLRTEIFGELGVIRRHLDDLAGASAAFSTQLDLAIGLGQTRAFCRALGNLGVVNYQRYLLEDDAAYLDLAIKLLEERVKTARLLNDDKVTITDAGSRDRDMREAWLWEAIGLDRLSLCYTVRGDMTASLSASRAAIDVAALISDATVQGMCRFFHARALIFDGQMAEASIQLNKSMRCPPVVALCKEPSKEHCKYLQEAIDAGADLDVVDEHGYSALDYAIFTSDGPTQDVVLACLQQQLIDRRLTQAKLRKGYRVLMQEYLRPTLNAVHDHRFWMELRKSYAAGLEQTSDGDVLFGDFKLIRYQDFLRAGKIPRSDEGFTQHFTADMPVNFVVFFSYRWLGTQAGLPNPDDDVHTQYRRMVTAIEALCDLNPAIKSERLGIWVVSHSSPFTMSRTTV